MQKRIMNDKNNPPKPGNDLTRPDPETLHTTDPQEEMEGPVSSLMNNVGDKVESEGKKVNPDPEDEGK
jgi:hypothetical protein